MSQVLEFIFDFAVFGAIALVLATPVVFIGLRRGQTRTVGRFAIVGCAVALACALLSLGSKSLVRRCLEAGNTECLDYGTLGMQLLALGLYGVVSLVRAVSMARN